MRSDIVCRPSRSFWIKSHRWARLVLNWGHGNYFSDGKFHQTINHRTTTLGTFTLRTVSISGLSRNSLNSTVEENNGTVFMKDTISKITKNTILIDVYHPNTHSLDLKFTFCFWIYGYCSHIIIIIKLRRKLLWTKREQFLSITWKHSFRIKFLGREILLLRQVTRQLRWIQREP